MGMLNALIVNKTMSFKVIDNKLLKSILKYENESTV